MKNTSFYNAKLKVIAKNMTMLTLRLSEIGNLSEFFDTYKLEIFDNLFKLTLP